MTTPSSPGSSGPLEQSPHGVVAEPAWTRALDTVRQHALLLETPEGSGTAFFLAPPDKNQVVGIATARHVVERAVRWVQPIRLSSVERGKSVLLMPGQFSFHASTSLDLALLRISYSGRGRLQSQLQGEDPPIPLPSAFLPHLDQVRLVPGEEIGWCGYPAVAPRTLCFFSGRVSAWLEEELGYLVDGVAINGVSGGPAFVHEESTPAVLVGVVTAYIPNRATGEALPGVSLVRAINPYVSLFNKLEGEPADGTSDAGGDDSATSQGLSP